MNIIKISHKTASLFAALSFGIALQIITVFVSKEKYTCNDSTSDSYISILQVLEALYIVVACALLYIYMLDVKTIETYYEYVKISALVLAGFSTGILIAYLILQSVICNDKCLRGSTALNAIAAGRSKFEDPRVVKFIQETSTMTGATATTSAYIDNALTPVWFETRNNYCKEKLQSLPGTNTYVNSVAERCLVWACTKEIVNNVEIAEGTFLFGLVLQCLLSFFIILKYRSSTNEPNTDKNTTTKTTEPQKMLSMPTSITTEPNNGDDLPGLFPSRKRFHAVRYNNLPQDHINF